MPQDIEYKNELIRENPWQELRRYTQARIALGAVGGSLPTREVLQFSLAHAQARDAVHQPLDMAKLQENVRQQGFYSLTVRSQAQNRQEYLLRPDLGRRLAAESLTFLENLGKTTTLAVVVADGLSAFAVENHALPLLQHLRLYFDTDWPQTPIVLAEQGRVALGDEVGAAFKASLVLVLIGERPGLSSPDSLGAYLTYQPKLGRMDSERNCVSNIHHQGLSYQVAAAKIAYLLKEALRHQLSGVSLKDASEVLAIDS